MRKFKIIATSLAVSMCFMAIGCSSDTKTSANETTVNSGEKDTDPTQETTTEPPTTAEETTSSSYAGNFSEFDTDIKEWGVGTNRLDDGRYEGPVYAQNKWGNDFKVDFIKENEKVIYLTFDEGYENGYTPAILDTLKEKNVKAVFFVTMDYVKREPELVKRMIEDGHVVGNHSVSHPSMPTLSAEKMKEEITGLHEYVKENFNYDMFLFRPPMGHYSDQSLAVTESLGYTTVLWSFAHMDWDPDNQPSHEEALQTTIDRMHNGAIYLLHAVSESNTSILGQFIDKAEAEGYTFVEYTRN